MRIASLPIASLVLTLFVAAGCGGGGGETPAPVTVTIFSTPGLDGYVFGNNVETNADLLVGDNGPSGFRSFVSFDLNVLPPGATVLKADLRMVQFAVMDNPYVTMGPLLVDQVVYGTALDAGSYGRTFPAHQGFGALSTNATLGTKTLVVTTQVQADLANSRTQSQFRLRFPPDNDSDLVADLAKFYSVETALTPDERPALIVTYQPQ